MRSAVEKSRTLFAFQNLEAICEPEKALRILATWCRHALIILLSRRRIPQFICRPPESDFERCPWPFLRLRPIAAFSKDAFRIQKLRTLLPDRLPRSPSLL